MALSTEASDSEDDEDFEMDSDEDGVGVKPGSKLAAVSKSLQTTGSMRSSTRPRRAAASQSAIVDLCSDDSEDEIVSPVRRKAAGTKPASQVKPEPLGEKPVQARMPATLDTAELAAPLQV